jgi:hypothetical protein
MGLGLQISEIGCMESNKTIHELNVWIWEKKSKD